LFENAQSTAGRKDQEQFQAREKVLVQLQMLKDSCYETVQAIDLDNNSYLAVLKEFVKTLGILKMSIN